MNQALENQALRVVGRGEAEQPDLALLDPRLRAVVRYADQAAWTTATAVARALDPVRAFLATAHDSVASLAVSDQGPQETMQALQEATQAGSSSPLRFPAGNPGSLAGVPCILFGFRGPSLNLTLPPADAVPVGFDLAAQWLGRGVAEYVVFSACAVAANTRPVTRSVILSPNRSSDRLGEPLTTADVHWLGSVGA